MIDKIKLERSLDGVPPSVHKEIKENKKVLLNNEIALQLDKNHNTDIVARKVTKEDLERLKNVSFTGTDNFKGNIYDITKKMYYGKGNNGLLQISKFNLNNEFREQNIKQQSGFAAEVISTARENIEAIKNNKGCRTFLANELEEYHNNDPYVDKVRIYDNGKIERIQTKFVGKDATDCLQKLMSKKYDKYFTDGKVDKIEIPKEYYKEIKDNDLIGHRITKLQLQLERVDADGKTDVAEGIEQRIAKLRQLDSMLESSVVTTDEARYARLHPKRYTTKLFVNETVSISHESGKEAGKQAMMITAAMTTVDNIQLVITGEINVKEAFMDVAKNTGEAGMIGYGTEFISTTVSNMMSDSSHAFLKSLSKAGVPAAAVSFGVDSFDSVVDYAQGNIDEKELAYDLGESGAGVAGSIAGSALAGAVVGSIVPGTGTAAGFATGMVGGMVGYALTTEAYKTAIEFGSDGIEILENKAKSLATSTIELLKQNAPDKVENIKIAFNDFSSENGLPFNFV